MSPNVHTAARWLARNHWKASPAYWADQAQIRYNLSDQETSLLLHNMYCQLGQN